MPVYDDHFTSEDRRTLTQATVVLEYIKGDIEEIGTTIKAQAERTERALASEAASREAAIRVLDARIRTLEDFRWYLMGGASLLGLIAGWIGKHFG